MAKFHERFSDAEQLAIVSGQPAPDPGPWEKLRGFAWLAYILSRPKWSWRRLESFVTENLSRTNLVRQWELGETSPSRHSARKLKDELPESYELFQLPLWGLLANRPRPSSDCRKAIRRYLSGDDSDPVYNYPDSSPLAKGSPEFSPAHRGDTATMVKRGDIYALTTAVALLREAEANYQDKLFIFHLANLYRMLVPLSKIPYTLAVVPMLGAAFDNLRRRLVLADVSIGVDWKLLQYQISHPRYYPHMQLRPHTEFDGEYALDIDPVIYADLVRQSSVGSPDDLFGAIYEGPAN